MNIFITGTDTDVGKTVVTAGISALMQKEGYSAGVYKPLQSGAIVKSNGFESPDLNFVKNVSPETRLKTTYMLKAPTAPSVAAELENIAIDTSKLLQDYQEMRRNCNFVIVEGAGGLLVPVYKEFLMRDLAKSLNLPLIIVARPDLGTINHTLLTIEAAKNHNIDIIGVVISNYPENTKDPAVTTAPEIIERLSGVKILGIIPHVEGINDNSFDKDKFIKIFSDSINVKDILKLQLRAKQ